MNTFGDIDAIRNMEEDEEEEEEEEQRVLAKIMLHSAPVAYPQKMTLPGLSQTCSAVAWCGKSNIIACATEICAREPGSNQQPAFWIPVHIFDPERPSEHAIFNVPAETPNDGVEVLEWSPVCCSQALLVGNSCGRVTVWSQPTQGSASVAHTINCWSCEHEFWQEQAMKIKWVAGLPPYRFSSTPLMSAPSSKSLEERFLAHIPRSAVRWPNFLCICSITYSGSVQLHWRQWPSAQTGSSPKWFSTSKAVLGAGPSGLFASDTIITDTGSLLVAGTPIGTPSTVIVWEISPGVVNHSGGSQQQIKYGMPVPTPLALGPPPWPGIAPLAAYLLSWQEHSTSDPKPAQWAGQLRVEDEEEPGPVLHCSPISNLSAYVAPDASTLTTWGSGVVEIAFDPSRGGSALMTMICEGYFISPECPDDGPTLTGWRFQRWESSRQPVAIHPLFEGTGAYPASAPATITSWTAVSSKSISQKNAFRQQTSVLAAECGVWKKFDALPKPNNPRCVAKMQFSAVGEFALSISTGEVYVFPVSSMIPTESFLVRTGRSYPPGVAFSPTSCCVALAWHHKKEDCSLLKIACLEPCNAAASQGSLGGSLAWERHLADRFWWSLVNELDWWDIIACTQYAVEDGIVTVAKVAAVLDADFHALPNPLHRQHYSKALDKIKCRMLEGTDAADIRALVLDMQARLLLDMLGKGVEAALTNPATLVAEPWLASSETLQALGADAMAVDPALVPSIQAYVDSILDVASHFLTRLRRYASFCRTLASHSVANSSGDKFSRPGANLSNGGTTQAGQGAATLSNSASNAGTAPAVNAFFQSAMAVAKGNSAEGATANAPGSGTAQSAPLPLTVSTATFPGIPAVRLVGDPQFLHRLCQLLFFCLIFRKRQVPRFVPGPRIAADSTSTAGKVVGGVAPKTEDTSATSGVTRSSSAGSIIKTEDGTRVASTSKSEENPRSVRVGNGNAGQGYTPDEVKFLFLVLVDLCKRTSMHPHPMPKSQVGITQPIMRLHYVDGQYSVTPEVVEASLSPHMQPQLPRPRGADAAGLLMRELELHPPAEEWNRRVVCLGPWNSRHLDLESVQEEDQTPFSLWPRKRRYAERDAALGLRTAIGLGSFSGFMGSRRDVVTGAWKTAHHAIWHKCMRCGRQTASLAAPTLASGGSAAPTSNREAWWTGRWVYGCPMCGGRWARML
ncbi:unnamed protein product [Calypogeia fissa]